MIQYRAANPVDADALAELGRTSFVDAFGHLYSPEDLSSFLESTYTPEIAAADIANPMRLFRIAESEGVMLGYCKLGFDKSLDYEAGDRSVVELKQLYLRGKQTGSGIGGALMDWALGEARARGADEAVLSVWSENHGAQRFYHKHGFEKVGDTIFMVGNQRDEEYLFGLRLR